MVAKLGIVSLALGCCALVAGAGGANAGMKVQTKHYSIAGSTGLQLYASMVKRGPRHGFTSRAIAQTAYTVEWDAEVQSVAGSCRVVAARPTVSITYTYPKLAGAVSPGLQKRWNRFMAGVRKHEEKHGRIARQMVDEAVRSVRGLKMAGDPNCRKTRAEIKRRAKQTYTRYEAQQVLFDKVEHKDGGAIDRLILGLIKG